MGKIAKLVRYDEKPAARVEPYAINTVYKSNFPADWPSLAIAGTIRPTIMNGIKNFKSSSNNPLKVAKMRPIQVGTIKPKIVPNMIATTTLNSKLPVIFFMRYNTFYFSKKLFTYLCIVVQQSKLIDIRSLSLSELKDKLTAMGEQGFRGKQIYEWLWVKSCTDFDQMTNLSKGLRETLKNNFEIRAVQVRASQVSSDK